MIVGFDGSHSGGPIGSWLPWEVSLGVRGERYGTRLDVLAAIDCSISFSVLLNERAAAVPPPRPRPSEIVPI